MKRKLLAPLRTVMAAFIMIFATNFASVTAVYAADEPHSGDIQWGQQGRDLANPADCQPGQQTEFHFILAPTGVTIVTPGTITVTFNGVTTGTDAGELSSDGQNSGSAQYFVSGTYNAEATDAVVSGATWTTNSNGNSSAMPLLTLSSTQCTGTPTPIIPIPAAPTAVASVIACDPDSDSTDKVSVVVTNTADETGAAVTYTIVLGGQTKTLTLADGTTGNLEFGDLAAGSYTATVTGSDGSVTTDSVNVGTCSLPLPVPKAPTAVAVIVPCKADSDSTDKVSVVVTNTSDETSASVTYTIVLGGQTKTLTLADGATGNVEFGDLAAGSYTATVTGSDGTVSTNSVNVKMCEETETQKVTLCHATGSESNTFVEITVAAAGVFNGHEGSEYGNERGDHQDSRDIIPPFTYNGQRYPGQNWDEQGQATYNNHCVPVTVPVVTPVTPVTPGRGGEGEETSVSTVFATVALPTAFTTTAVTPAAVTSTAPELANTGESNWSSVAIASTVAMLALALGAVSRRRQTN